MLDGSARGGRFGFSRFRWRVRGTVAIEQSGSAESMPALVRRTWIEARVCTGKGSGTDVV